MTECPICINESTDNPFHVTLCNHNFHINCLFIWISGTNDSNKKCPMCRTGLNLANIRKEYQACQTPALISLSDYLSHPDVQCMGRRKNIIIIKMDSPVFSEFGPKSGSSE